MTKKKILMVCEAFGGGVCRLFVYNGERLILEIYCARRRNLLQPKKEECDQSNCDESVSSGSTAPA